MTFTWTSRRTAVAGLAVAALAATVLTVPGAAAAAPSPRATGATCATTTDSEYATGATAAAIGWAGNDQAVVACLSGSFVVKNTQQLYGYGVWNGSRTTWTNAERYLPALVTSFRRDDGSRVSITNFGDKLSINGKQFVAVYSRVTVVNPGKHAVTVDPEPTANLTPLNHASKRVPAGGRVNHDYVTFSDKFAGTYDYPTNARLVGAGGFDQHYRHMKQYWTGQVAKLAQITQLPDPRLIDAYRTGFVYTQITRAGSYLKTGVNGYDKEYSHDVIGILANMLTQGFRSDGTTTDKDLLLRLRDVVGGQAQYDDGIYKYAWPWAIYLQKTGDTAFVKANFATPGPQGSELEPSIKDSARAIVADRTGPGGIMHNTPDIDADGYWTIDNYSALMGLAAYRWLAQQLGDRSEYRWASDQYSSLLGAVNQTLTATMAKYHLNYLPCSMLEPNDNNRCSMPTDANWAAPFLFGRWAWDAYLFEAPINGPGYDYIDATYKYGFDRLKGIRPANTFGGYGDTDYSTGYNAGYGEWGLASNNYRSQTIYSYQFMIDNTQSGPYSWWESVQAPDPNSPWAGNHPTAGAGASPHAWGSADANLALLASLVAERGDGSLIVGRGVPNAWIGHGKTIQVRNLPLARGKHAGVTITSRGTKVTLQLDGQTPSGPTLFQLPAFVRNIAHASAGAIDPATGTVVLSARTRSVTVTLRHGV